MMFEACRWAFGSAGAERWRSAGTERWRDPRVHRLCIATLCGQQIQAEHSGLRTQRPGSNSLTSLQQRQRYGVTQ